MEAFSRPAPGTSSFADYWHKLCALPLPILLLLPAIPAAILRAVFFRAPFMGIDTYHYLKMVRAMQSPWTWKSFPQLYGVDNFPPFFTMLAALVAPMAGSDLGGLRLVSYLSGVALVCVGAALTWELCRDRSTTLASGILLACSPPLIWHSACGRNFSLAYLLMLAAVLLTLKTAREWRLGPAIISAGLWIMAYLTRYEMIVGLLVALLYLGWEAARANHPQKLRPGVVLSSFVLVAAFLILPYLLYLHGLTGHWIVAPRHDELSRARWAHYETGLSLEQVPDFTDPPQGWEYLGSWWKSLPLGLKSLWDNLPPLILLLFIIGLAGRAPPRARILAAFCLPVAIFPMSEPVYQDFHYYSLVVPLVLPVAAMAAVSLYRDLLSRPGYGGKRFCWLCLLSALAVFWAWQFIGDPHPEFKPGSMWDQDFPRVALDSIYHLLVLGVMLLQAVFLAFYLYSRRWGWAFIFLGLAAVFIGMIYWAQEHLMPWRTRLASAGWHLLTGASAYNLVLLILLLAALLIYMKQFVHILSSPSPKPARILLLALSWLLVIWGQNLAVREILLRSWQFASCPARVVESMADQVHSDTVIMCPDPWLAWQLGCDWIKLPPTAPMNANVIRWADFVVWNDFFPGSPQVEEVLEEQRRRKSLEIQADLMLRSAGLPVREINYCVYRVVHPQKYQPGSPGGRGGS